MKKVIALLLALVMLFGIAACGNQPANTNTTPAPSNDANTNTGDANAADNTATDDPFAAIGDVKWRHSTQSPSTNVVGQMAQWIGEEVAKRTNGHFQVEVYTDGVLYSDKECIEALQAGALDSGQGGWGTLGKFADYTNAVSLPFLAQSWDELNDLCFGDKFAGARELLYKSIEDAGLVPLGFYSTGLRNFTNNKRPVESLADMAGLKIRVQSNDVYIDTFNAFGAYPVPMAASELLVALQQGTVDAEENPLDFVYNDGFYEFQKYITTTHHIATIAGYEVSQKSWDALPDEYKKIYQEVITEACQKLNAQAEAEEEKYRKILTDAGCEIVDPSEEFIEEMREAAMTKVWPKYEEKYAEFLEYFK